MSFQPPKTNEEINRLIALPKILRTDDGRVLRIRSWAPVSECRSLPTVTVEAIIVFEPDPANVPQQFH